MRIKDVKGYLEEMALRDCAEGVEDSPAEKLCDTYEFGWIYKKAGDLKWEIMSDLTEPSIRRKIAELVSAEYLWKRQNPKYKWDKTLQYRVNLVKIEADLNAIGYSLSTVMGKDFPTVKSYVSKENDERSREKIESSRVGNFSSVENDDSSNKNSNRSDENHFPAIPETTNRDYNPKITNRDYNKRGGEARAQEKADVKNFPDEVSDQGSVKAVNSTYLDPLEHQDSDRGKFSASAPQNQPIEEVSREGLILPKPQQRPFWRALTAYIEKTNPKMSRGRAESIASASTERLLNRIPKVQDQEYLELYLQGILTCYADNKINYQTIKEHQTLEELRGMLYD